MFQKQARHFLGKFNQFAKKKNEFACKNKNSSNKSDQRIEQVRFVTIS